LSCLDDRVRLGLLISSDDENVGLGVFLGVSRVIEAGRALGGGGCAMHFVISSSDSSESEKDIMDIAIITFGTFYGGQNSEMAHGREKDFPMKLFESRSMAIIYSPLHQVVHNSCSRRFWSGQKIAASTFPAALCIFGKMNNDHANSFLLVWLSRVLLTHKEKQLQRKLLSKCFMLLKGYRRHSSIPDSFDRASYDVCMKS
jgi:hypothetical protein